MKQTIEIDVPKGMKAVYNEKEQKIEFVPEIIWPSVVDATLSRGDLYTELDEKFPMGIKDSLIALFKLWAIRRELFTKNGGDCGNESDLKFCITRELTIDVGSTSDVHPVLKFPNLALARGFCNRYNHIIKDFYNGMIL